ncbi:MAG: NrsF family protein [Rhizomicrobium sp.]
MKTDELTARLSADLVPAPSHYVSRVLAAGLGIGILASILLMLLAMGLRADLSTAMEASAFWMKLAYTLSFVGLSFWMVERLGRPGASIKLPLRFLALPVVILLMLAIAQLTAPGADRTHLVLGDSWDVCALDILTISLPAFLAVFWAVRQLAPTRLALAGAAAGLLCGATGASVYAFHCVEYTAPFILIWYTSGIAAASTVGALAGRWALKW